MKEYQISIIVPIYNTEKHLRKALLSLEAQTYKDFKAILVNDGSTDGSAKIIAEFAVRNKNFTIINQENKGVGAARNSGIKASNTKYIAFMDSDDFLEPDFLKKLYSAALKTDADIVCCNFNFYFPKTRMKFFWPFMTLPGIYSGEKALKKITSCVGMLAFAWNKFFKREIFVKNGIEFSDMYYEDSATSPKLFYFAKKITVIHNILYNYVMHGRSITHSMDAKKINDFIKSLGIMRNFYEKKGIYKRFRRRLKGYSARLELINFYNIFAMHLKSTNFRGFFRNLQAIDRSIKYFSSDEYTLEENELKVKPVQLIKDPKEME
jgi:glycosyltransferase involved in cell wall biosynthesis